jgi:hypothetical protein
MLLYLEGGYTNESDIENLIVGLEDIFYRNFPDSAVEIVSSTDDSGRDTVKVKAFRACDFCNRDNDENSKLYMELTIIFTSLSLYIVSDGCVIYKPGTQHSQPIRFTGSPSGNEAYILKRFDSLCKTFKRTYKSLYN